MKTRVLVVDPDEGTAADLAERLERNGYEVARVATGRAALAAWTHADLVLLDLGLRDVDALEVCAQIRGAGITPVITLAAAWNGGRPRPQLPGRGRRLPHQAVRLPGTRGADLRHHAPASAPPSSTSAISHGALRIDPQGRQVHVGERAVKVTRKEFDLLHLLASMPRTVVSRRELMARVWADEWFVSNRTVDTHISALRGKLGPGEWIVTVRGSATGWDREAPNPGPRTARSDTAGCPRRHSDSSSSCRCSRARAEMPTASASTALRPAGLHAFGHLGPRQARQEDVPEAGERVVRAGLGVVGDLQADPGGRRDHRAGDLLEADVGGQLVVPGRLGEQAFDTGVPLLVERLSACAGAVGAQPEARPYHHVPAQQAGEGVRHVGERLERVRVGVVGDPPGPPQEARARLLDRVGDRLLVPEVEVECSRTDPGTRADVEDRGQRVAVLVEDPCRRVEQSTAGADGTIRSFCQQLNLLLLAHRRAVRALSGRFLSERFLSAEPC